MLHRQDIYTIGHPAMEGIYQPFIDLAMKETGQTIIDIGCGYGNYTKELQKLGKTITGLEYNPDYVKKARANGVDCLQGDARKTSFKDNEFESAVLFEVLEHIEEPEKVIREALRVTSKNVILTVPNSTELELLKRNDLGYYHLITEDHVNFFSEDDMHRIAKDLGANVEVRPSEPIWASRLLPFNSPMQWIIRKLEPRGMMAPITHNRLYCIFTKPNPS